MTLRPAAALLQSFGPAGLADSNDTETREHESWSGIPTRTAPDPVALDEAYRRGFAHGQSDCEARLADELARRETVWRENARLEQAGEIGRLCDALTKECARTLDMFASDVSNLVSEALADILPAAVTSRAVSELKAVLSARFRGPDEHLKISGPKPLVATLAVCVGDLGWNTDILETSGPEVFFDFVDGHIETCISAWRDGLLKDISA